MNLRTWWLRSFDRGSMCRGLWGHPAPL